MNAMEGTQTVNLRFYKCSSCVGTAAIYGRKTAAFNTSNIL